MEQTKVIHRPRVERYEYHINLLLASGQRTYRRPVEVVIKRRVH